MKEMNSFKINTLENSPEYSFHNRLHFRRVLSVGVYLVEDFEDVEDIVVFLFSVLCTFENLLYPVWSSFNHFAELSCLNSWLPFTFSLKKGKRDTSYKL